MNKCTFIGRVGQDPDIRAMQNGNEVANFSLAVTERWKDKDGQKKESTEWVKCVCFSALTSVIKGYVHKGSQIAVVGKMKTRKWQNQQGQDQYTTEVIIDELELLGGSEKSAQTQHNEAKANAYQPQPMQDDFDSEIPF